MGNYISCTLIGPSMKNSRAARVIFPGGEVRQFRQPVKAAEVMLESPNFFLVNSRSLHMGRRFGALAADEELELGSVYIMFPMRRVNSVVTAADVAVLFLAANSAAKRLGGGKVRVVAEEGGGDRGREVMVRVGGDGGGDGEGEGEGEGFPATEFRYRLSACRSRKPMLETIREESVCSR